MRDREAEVGRGGDEDSRAEGSDDRFGGRRGQVGVGGVDVDEESGDAMQAAEATADVEDLVGVEGHGASGDDRGFTIEVASSGKDLWGWSAAIGLASWVWVGGAGGG